MNAVEIEEAISSLAEQPFDAVAFPYAFLEAFGNKATTIQRLKGGNTNKTDIEGAVLQYNNIHMAVSAKGDVLGTLGKLKNSPATARQKARFVLATDGEDFQAEDLTSGDVNKRLINAKLDPTFLMADVEVVATYELSNINRTKLENLLHRFFEPAKLNIEIKDRFGNPIVPREWFFVPLFVIDEVIEKVKDGTIVNCTYDVSKQEIRGKDK